MHFLMIPSYIQTEWLLLKKYDEAWQSLRVVVLFRLSSIFAQQAAHKGLSLKGLKATPHIKQDKG